MLLICSFSRQWLLKILLPALYYVAAADGACRHSSYFVVLPPILHVTLLSVAICTHNFLSYLHSTHVSANDNLGPIPDRQMKEGVCWLDLLTLFVKVKSPISHQLINSLPHNFCLILYF